MRIRIVGIIYAWATARFHRPGRSGRARGAGDASRRAGIPAWLPISLCLVILGLAMTTTRSRGAGGGPPAQDSFDLQIQNNANQMISDGRRIFRFDTFGDEAF